MISHDNSQALSSAQDNFHAIFLMTLVKIIFRLYTLWWLVKILLRLYVLWYIIKIFLKWYLLWWLVKKILRQYLMWKLAFRTFVQFALVWFCQFPLPLGWGAACDCGLLGLFSYLFGQYISTKVSSRTTVVKTFLRLYPLWRLWSI